MSVKLSNASRDLGHALLSGAPRSNDGSNHANDRQYTTLRDRAHEAQSKHMHFAGEASKAYNNGDKSQASEFSQKSKKYQAEAAELNDEAASWVFAANNTDSAKDEIDLHGLYVKEALVALDARLEVCMQANQPVLKAIVGKGLHSETHIAKLRPAVMDHCSERRIPTKVDPNNAGVVLIEVSSGQGAPAQSLAGPSQGYSQSQGYQQPGGYSQPQQQQSYQQPASGTAGQEGVNWCALLTAVVSRCLK